MTLAFTFWLTKLLGGWLCIIIGARDYRHVRLFAWCALAVFLIYFENYYKQLQYAWGF